MATLLVVDDDPAIVSLTSHILEIAGHLVFAAVGGALGIAAFDLHAPRIHAVLMDLVMPEVDGLAAFHYMRHHRPDVPVVFVTGSVSELPETVLAAPRVAVLAKPFRSKELVATVDRVLATLTGPLAVEAPARLLAPIPRDFFRSNQPPI